MEPEGRPSSEALDVHKQTWSHGSWAPPNVERKRGAEMGPWSWGSSPASLHTGGEQRLYRVGALGRGGGRRSVPVAEEGCVASFTCWKLARQLGTPSDLQRPCGARRASSGRMKRLLKEPVLSPAGFSARAFQPMHRDAEQDKALGRPSSTRGAPLGPAHGDPKAGGCPLTP